MYGEYKVDIAIKDPFTTPSLLHPNNLAIKMIHNLILKPLARVLYKLSNPMWLGLGRKEQKK
jgi:hypothetical protein